jgi:hypothetical protein
MDSLSNVGFRLFILSVFSGWTHYRDVMEKKTITTKWSMTQVDPISVCFTKQVKNKIKIKISDLIICLTLYGS